MAGDNATASADVLLERALGRQSCSIDMSVQPNYYEADSDNSVACWLTNYFLGGAIVGYIVYLVVGRRAPFWVEHTRIFIIGDFAFTGISVVLAGGFHQGWVGRAGDVEDGGNPALWALVEALLVLAGGFTTTAAWSMVTKVDNSIRSAVAYGLAFVTGVALTIWVVLADVPFLIPGLFGEILPNFVLTGAAYAVTRLFPATEGSTNGWASSLRFANIVAVSVAVILVGAGVQAGLGGVCGVKCPVDCPLPAPAFNHNALFHVIQIVGMGVMTWGMGGMCGFLEDEATNRSAAANVSKTSEDQADEEGPEPPAVF